MNPCCPICGLPESEHYYDRAAWGCRGFDGTEGHPCREVKLSLAPLYIAIATIAALLIFAFCCGEWIDRAWIIVGLLLFAPAMAGGVPEARAKAGEELDS
jgi:hypothetical protein